MSGAEEGFSTPSVVLREREEEEEGPADPRELLTEEAMSYFRMMGIKVPSNLVPPQEKGRSDSLTLSCAAGVHVWEGQRMQVPFKVISHKSVPQREL